MVALPLPLLPPRSPLCRPLTVGSPQCSPLRRDLRRELRSEQFLELTLPRFLLPLPDVLILRLGLRRKRLCRSSFFQILSLPLPPLLIS